LWFLGATVVAFAVFGVVFVASSGASLSTSPFEGGDGNMVVDTPGNTDWESLSPPVLRTLVDVPSGQSDNSFTGGSHEDDPNVTIAQGSIPPNKNDLTRAYAASEKVSGETFLYLAWERQPNPNGSANIDFELDQNASPGDFTQPGDLTINRTEGDILITYDFGGSGTPDLGLLTWLTPGHGHSNSDCQASGATLPCWGNRIDLNPSSNPPAEAGVNASSIDEVFAGGQLDAGTFGETKIDLSAIPGLFTPDTCTEFGSMFVKSRSSGSSIDAELKDFIGPAPIQVSNCATPSISTALSSSAGNVGLKVHDSATLAGATADAGGTVTYSVYSDSACTHKVADGGTVDVTNGSVPNSSDVTFNTPGTYYWQASYSGDKHNDAAVSTCTDEQLLVAPLIDLAITKIGSPNPDTLPGNITWTMVVTNHGPDAATGVTISDPLPAGNTFVSVSTSKGSCTGGAIIHCAIGNMAPGESVTITLVTTPSVAGTVTNKVTVAGNETETNTANNTATATVIVQAPFVPPPVYCVAVSRVAPTQLFVGRKTTLTIRVSQHGKAVKGVRVRIRGSKLNLRTKPSNSRGVIRQTVRPRRAGVVIFTPIASSRCNTMRLGVTGVFTPPVTG
jgi:uncharacterized repeat protein (TIGR01451 family)